MNDEESIREMRKIRTKFVQMEERNQKDPGIVIQQIVVCTEGIMFSRWQRAMFLLPVRQKRSN